MSQPWFAFYLDDYERKTADLSMLYHGAYGELLRRYYMNGGPLPANAEQVHRMCRAMDDAERAAIDYCLNRYFHLEADGWHHDRCDEELAKAREISEKRSKSAQLKHSKNSANAHASAEQMQTQPQPHTHITTPPINPPQKFTLPDWVPAEQWEAYVEMRRIIGKRLTPRGRELAIAKLEKLRRDGHDPTAVLNNSIFNSYQGLFPPNEDSHGKNQPVRTERVSAQSARIERNRQASADLLREIYPDSAMVESGGGAIPPRHSNRSPDAVLAQEPVTLPPRSH